MWCKLHDVLLFIFMWRKLHYAFLFSFMRGTKYIYLITCNIIQLKKEQFYLPLHVYFSYHEKLIQLTFTFIYTGYYDVITSYYDAWQFYFVFILSLLIYAELILQRSIYTDQITMNRYRMMIRVMRMQFLGAANHSTGKAESLIRKFVQ